MTIKKHIRGIRDAIPSGYAIGRTSGGSGPPELIPIGGLDSQGRIPAPVPKNQLIGDLADGTVMANISGAAAKPIGSTLTAIFDYVFGNVRGSILVRAAAAWVRLGPGTAAQFLQTQGAGADVQWATVAIGSAPNGMLPLVNGDLPGPGIMADASGQCIGVVL